jgi:hypothetical protein
MAAAALLGNIVLFDESREKLVKKGGLEKLMKVSMSAFAVVVASICMFVGRNT